MPIEANHGRHPLGPAADTDRFILGLRAPVIVHGLGRVLPLQHVGGPELALYGGRPISSGQGRSFAIDGAAILGRNVVTRHHGEEVIQAKLAASNFADIAAWWGANARNPSVLYVIDEDTSRALVLPDPLGGALVYSFVDGGLTVHSSDMNSLLVVLAEAGYIPRKSRQFQVERVLLGNGGVTQTSYESVHTLEPFEYAQLGPEGHERLPLRSPNLTDASYPELINHLRQEILDAVVGLAALPAEQRIAHLTGGFDSRLVLGAILEAGLADKFSFFCSGPTGTTDRKIADGLTEAYSLQRTGSAGLAPAKTSNLTERLLAPMFNSGGITSSGPTGRENPTAVVSLGGGYGEVLRTFYGSRVASHDATRITGQQLLACIAPNAVNGSSFFVQERVDELQSNLHSRWTALCGTFSDVPDFVGDALYTYTRNRYHIGQNSMLWSRVGARFDPLYSYQGFLAAQSVPQSARSANIIGYDLITSMDARLAQFSFDKPRFATAEFLQSRRPPAEISLPEWRKETYVQATPPTFNEKPVIPESLEEMIVPDFVATGAERQGYISAANRIGVNYWQVASLSGAQSALKRMLRHDTIADLSDTIDLDYVNGLTTKGLTKRQEIRDVYGLISLVGWLAS